MQKAPKSLSIFAKFAAFVSLTFLAGNTLAQSNVGNIVNVASPDICAAACGSDNMCASWTFKPNPTINGQSNGGQCQFSKPNPNNQNFVQTRPSINVPNWTQSNIPSWSAPNSRGGNYAITPLPNTAAPAPRMASAPQPMPANPAPRIQPQTHAQQTTNAMTNRSAPISFDRPTNSANTNAQMQATQQQLNWRPVETSAPREQSPNLNNYRSNDGTIDAAQMRRDQLAAQNKSGQPRYSVQGEWSNVAQSVANGQNYANVDLANSRPIPQPPEPVAKTQVTQEMLSIPRTRGPLRAGRSNKNQSATTAETDEQKKGFFQTIGGMFNRGSSASSEQNYDNGPTESERTTSMHGPLRKRAAN